MGMASASGALSLYLHPAPNPETGAETATTPLVIAAMESRAAGVPCPEGGGAAWG